MSELRGRSELNRCQRRELVAFFLLAFGFTWACWIGSIFVGNGNVRHWLALAGQFGPLLAAMFLTACASGRAGLRRFVGSFVNWRFNVGLALLALLLPPVAYYAAIALKSYLTGEPVPPYSYRILYDVLINFFLVVLWGGPLGEEPGWRGYALPRLQATCGPLVATLILGVLWAVWHFPRWWMAGEFPLRIVGTFIIALVAFSVVFTFLYNRARGSVLPCLLLHGSANTFYVILPVEWAWGAWTIVICAIAGMILALDRNLGAGPPVVPPVRSRGGQATASSATDGLRRARSSRPRMDSCRTAGFSGGTAAKMQRVAQVLQFPVVIQGRRTLLRES